MFREGEITVRLTLAQGRIASVDIASTRAPLPPALTHGRAPDEVAGLLPRLFAVCGQAQGAAAAAALDAAAGSAPSPQRHAARTAAITREAIVELASRLLLDWPRTLGVAPEVAAVARLRQVDAGAFDATAQAVAAGSVFGESPDAWLNRTTLDDWTTAGRTLPARLLAQLERENPGLGGVTVAALPTDSTWLDTLPALDDTGFAQRPTWHGEPALVGPLAQHRHHPLLSERNGDIAAHFIAQLIALAERLVAATAPAALSARRLADGSGAAVAETARGPLLHQARVADGAVTGYRIIAPTEWNFHPAGVLVSGLVRRPADAPHARRDAERLAQALDPCVACRVEVADA
jgi:coenzyme F420-reducing hydrogenase alpha subunit